MKYSICSFLFCLISSYCFADSLCGDGYFNAELGICQSGGGANYYPGQKTARTYQPRDYYGAIAADVVNGKSDGHSFNYRTSNAAEISALNFCGLKECQIIISYKNTCAATAVPLYTPDVQGLIYGAIGETPGAASLNAISKCKEANSNVRCVIWTKAACSYLE
ncbi:DUF4189 domain-containing protein [Leeia oryzae]|uniref:DUF4189 domain-containing protein n=1 Tax=Leeia oryzae TaxID=356662 RepID=UPI000A047653|nr:DUF4189 domain-containing protein [Leeia oryzae]